MSKTLMILFMFFCTLTVQAGQKKEKVILWMKFAHWKILANAITQNFIFRFVAEPYIERDL